MSVFDFFKAVDINQEVNRCRTTRGAILLDVRTEEEYRSGHISGSRNIPVEKIQNAENLLHDKSAPLFVYCLSGARSRKAVSALRKMGFTQAVSIGGIEQYKGQLQKGRR